MKPKLTEQSERKLMAEFIPAALLRFVKQCEAAGINSDIQLMSSRSAGLIRTDDPAPSKLGAGSCAQFLFIPTAKRFVDFFEIYPQLRD